MARTTKLYIDHSGFQERYVQAISSADDIDLMILGSLLLVADSDGVIDVNRLEELGRFDKSDIKASVKYWKGAGVFSGTRPNQQKNDAPEVTNEAVNKCSMIPHTSIEKYSNDELAAVIQRKVGTAFVDEAQKAMGKIFNTGEVGKLVGLVDQLGFEEEAVLAILSYCVRLGKKSLSYAEKIAITFHDEDIFTAEAVHAQIDLLERRNTAIEKVKSLFGFGGRALSATEKKLFVAWTETYGFDMDIITKAYEITVDSIHEPAPKYTNTILTEWYERGLKTVREIDEFIAEKKSNATAHASPKTKLSSKDQEKKAEIDDWFDKILQKSLGE